MAPPPWRSGSWGRWAIAPLRSASLVARRRARSSTPEAWQSAVAAEGFTQLQAGWRRCVIEPSYGALHQSDPQCVMMHCTNWAAVPAQDEISTNREVVMNLFTS